MRHPSGDTKADVAFPGPAPRLSQSVCAFCRTRLDVHQAVRGGVCGNPVCRGKHLQEIAKQRLARQADVRRSALAFRTRVASSLGVTDPESLTLAVIPYFNRPVVKLPRQRRQEARAHLNQIVREAFEQGPEGGEATARAGEDSVAAQPQSAFPQGRVSCGTCKGHCCQGGGAHAYLDVTVVRSYLTSHPGLRRREVLQAFLGAIPEVSFENSCVYHGRHGCALRREMRSSTCNRYQCTGLTGLRNALAASGCRPVLIVSASSDAIERSTFVHPDGTTVRVRCR